MNIGGKLANAAANKRGVDKNQSATSARITLAKLSYLAREAATLKMAQEELDVQTKTYLTKNQSIEVDQQ